MSRITLITAPIALCILAVGGLLIVHRLHHPAIEIPVALENSDAINAAIRSCSVLATFNLTYSKIGPVVLEQRFCPSNFHAGKIEPLDGPFSTQHREVLLVEKKSPFKTTVLTSRFSETNFRRVEPGFTDNGTQVVLWSAMNECGSCHSGPEGLLLFNPQSGRFDWNADWSPANKKLLEQALPEGHYLDEAESLFWDEGRSSLFLRADVHGGAGDAHCCPMGGSLDATIVIDGAEPRLTSLAYQPPRN